MMRDDHIFLVRAKLLKQMKNSRELHALIYSAAVYSRSASLQLEAEATGTSLLSE